jgi:hypothetical protein
VREGRACPSLLEWIAVCIEGGGDGGEIMGGVGVST